LQKAINEKTTKYKEANPGMDLEEPKKATVSNRVWRRTLDPERPAARGSRPQSRPRRLRGPHVAVRGRSYQSASGDITPEILTHAIKDVWGPCCPTRSAEKRVGSLCQAYGYHWDKEVLGAMKEKFFVGVMGVPSATGLWQVADIRNNGILKIKRVDAKRWLLHLKREDLMNPKEQRRVPEGEHEKLVRSDAVILLRMAFAPSHCDVVGEQAHHYGERRGTPHQAPAQPRRGHAGLR
jgi:hypothetical protein